MMDCYSQIISFYVYAGYRLLFLHSQNLGVQITPLGVSRVVEVQNVKCDIRVHLRLLNGPGHATVPSIIFVDIFLDSFLKCLIFLEMVYSPYPRKDHISPFKPTLLSGWFSDPSRDWTFPDPLLKNCWRIPPLNSWTFQKRRNITRRNDLTRNAGSFRCTVYLLCDIMQMECHVIWSHLMCYVM